MLASKEPHVPHWGHKPFHASMWVCKQNEIYYILLMNGGGVVFAFVSLGQKDFEKKKIKELPYNYKKSLFISGQREQVHSHIST